MTRTVVGVTGVRAILAAFAALGLDARALQSAAGITDAQLRDPDVVVPARFLYRMWEEAVSAWGRPGLGLHTALQVPFGAYEVLDYLVLSSSTVGEGLAHFAEYFAIATRTSRYEIHHRGESAAIEMVWQIPPEGVMFHLRDYSLAAIAGRVAFAGGPRPLRVELAGPPLADPGEYAEGFGTEVRLRARHNALVFNKAGWNAPLPRRDADLNRTLRRHARMLLDRQPRPEAQAATAQVRATLLQESMMGAATMEQVAHRLAASPRTLQRRLREEGTTFDEVSRTVREGLAREYLGDRGLSISEVAYLLGFSEPSAFTRAFRRWTGHSPRAFRKGQARLGSKVGGRSST
ncbi:MAG: AraC family transcriptional regulator ligand-binding domain-containing protein [Vicinamibacterales bacterium]